MKEITSWLGFISQEEVAKEWANMDVAIIPSTLDSESFGVSAVEAEACGTPVIISDIPGLMEATQPGKSSIVVKRKDERTLAQAIIKLFNNSKMRVDMGSAGRKFVVSKYALDFCFGNIEEKFYKIAKKQKNN
jgi:glycosyltransferase involved in cell wall biosynthesis